MAGQQAFSDLHLSPFCFCVQTIIPTYDLANSVTPTSQQNSSRGLSFSSDELSLWQDFLAFVLHATAVECTNSLAEVKQALVGVQDGEIMRLLAAINDETMHQLMDRFMREQHQRIQNIKAPSDESGLESVD